MELPASFIDYTRSLLGDKEYDKLAVAIQQEPPVSIRLKRESETLIQVKSFGRPRDLIKFKIES